MMKAILRKRRSGKNRFGLRLLTVGALSAFVIAGCLDFRDDAERFFVTYNGNGNTSGSAPVDQNTNYEDGFTVMVLDHGTLVKSGYRFSGWNTRADGNGASYAAGNTFKITDDVIFYAQWTADTSDNIIIKEPPMPTPKAEPIKASANPKVLGSYSDGELNYYLIDAGYIKNTLLSVIQYLRYSGMGTMSLEMTTVTENMITNSIIETVFNSIAISNTSQTVKSWEAGGKAGLSIKKIFKLELSGKYGESETEISSTYSVKSTETTISEIRSYSELHGSKTTITVSSSVGDPAGYYRYALYADVDVYFVISTSLDNQELKSWDIVSCARESEMKSFEYSLDGKFDNFSAEDKRIVFAEDFYRNLPLPKDSKIPEYTITLNANGGIAAPSSLIAKRGQKLSELPLSIPTKMGYAFKGWYSAASDGTRYEDIHIITGDITLYAQWVRSGTESKSYTTVGTFFYDFDSECSFATVEAYVYGAGGGGAGGSDNFEGVWPFGDGWKNTLGGAGGSGAATYAKVNVECGADPITIIVGEGGKGGGRRDSDGTSSGHNYGHPGTDGKPSSVTVGDAFIVAHGGKGGNDNKGGAGGDVVSQPNGIVSYPGNQGNDGGYNKGSNTGGTGAYGLPVPYSALQSGAGGKGGSNARGSDGGNGQVIIVVTYP
ncbi:MAG: InlB B-repeat-containing protein [Chitinispirillales bacterium]|nr:InlB B-repeat-containing protein [Chitinispirillales bacterium]